MSGMTDGTWEFYDQWAAFPHTRVQNDDRRVIGEFAVSLAAPSGGTYGGFGIRFYDFYQHERWREPRTAARLEAFGDSWQAIASNPELVAALSVLGQGPEQTPEAVRTALLAIGMTETTAKLRGTHPAYCPTCRGKGVLDDVAPAEAEPAKPEEAN